VEETVVDLLSRLRVWRRSIACIATVAVAVGSARAQEIVAVPWLGDPNLQHEVYSGGTMTLQSVALLPVGCTITAATWDPGDGGGPVAVSFANPRAIELAHVYTGLDFQPYTATVSITTTCGTTSDTFRVIIVPRTLDVDVNMAIDRGLWRLHKNEVLSSVGSVPTGYWATQNQAADTASSVLAFEVNGHRETGNRAEDPYVDDVARGLAHTFTELSRINISPQTAGNPDTNGNGFGLEVLDGGAPIYIGGQVIDAIVGSGTPDTLAPTGIVTDVLGRRYADVVQDLLDTYSYGQADTASFYRGGWRYGWNTQDADNSACQWWAIGGIAAERVFGLTVPQFVKDENLNFWIPQSQYFDGTNAGTDGRFGYTDDTNYVDIVGMNTTPSGLVQMNFDGALKTDARHLAAQRYMIRNWTSLTLNNRIYGMFATAKAMRLALPTPVVKMDENGAAPFDWYRSDTTAGDPVDGIARRLVSLQQADGSWDGAWVFNDLASAWAIITLSATIVQLAPHAVADVDPVITGPNQPVEFDGSPSFHSDPLRNIVLYEWDFDGDGTFDAAGQFVTHSYPVLGVYSAKLRVTDDNVPPLSDEKVATVNVTIPPYPPDSNPGRRYSFCLGVNEPFILDGSKSKDIDGSIVSWEWDFDPQPLDNDFDDATTPTVDVTAFFTALGPGIYDVGLTVTDDVTLFDTDFATVEVFAPGFCPVVGHDPTCVDGVSVNLWPGEHQYVDLDLKKLAGVTDALGDAITIVITSITQDEPVTYEDDKRDCDGFGIGGDIATIKSERANYKKSNGRVYRINYTATNTSGGSCSNFVTVIVPKKAGGTAVDDGQKYDSTQGCR
jgi:hypothetical protein